MTGKALGCIVAGIALATASPAAGGDARASKGAMALIPAGEFIMGASEGYGIVGVEIGVDAMPERRVRLNAFHIDVHEVTVAEYRRFIEATGHRAPPLWGPPYKDEYPPVRETDPISDVTWHEADEYCKWAGKRLPTEEEWEKAARGADGRKFPWGDEWIADIANTEEYSFKMQAPGRKSFTHTVAEVGGFKDDVSPYGVHDMGGNVMEWTASWYGAYPGSTLKRDIFGEKVKVMRGGSWMATPIPFSFAFNRHFSMPGEDDPHFGIRCARDASARE
jgi:formylglycine-generating enzyme required for sulfatase activity